MILIPINKGDVEFDCLSPPLEGVIYSLHLRWVVRPAAWFMDVYEQDGVTLLRAGIKLVANWPLDLYHTGRQPPGVFVAVDTASPQVGKGDDPDLDGLGDRWQLAYITQAELGG